MFAHSRPQQNLVNFNNLTAQQLEDLADAIALEFHRGPYFSTYIFVRDSVWFGPSNGMHTRRWWRALADLYNAFALVVEYHHDEHAADAALDEFNRVRYEEAHPQEL